MNRSRKTETDRQVSRWSRSWPMSWMMEAGCETEMTKKTRRDAVGVAMRKEPSRFRKDGEKWSVS